MKLIIKNGQRLIFNSSQRGDAHWQAFDAIVVENGKITAIDDHNAEHDGDQIVDAQGGKVFPGLQDLHVSLPEPGYATRGTIESEINAAIAGGVTTLCCLPETEPVNDSPAVTKLILEKTQQANGSKVLPLGALTQNLDGQSLAEYAALKEAGCVALSNTYHALGDLSITKRCFEYAKTHELSVYINPIEPSLHKGVMHSGEVSTTIGLPGISSLAETIAVSQLIKLAAATGVHLHLSQLSAGDSVDQVRLAKSQGINITADVAIQNLLYTDENVENFNSMFRCLPPLRSQADRQILIEGIKDGTIDAITSAHRPMEVAAKQAPFAETEPGMSNIEFLLPLAALLEDEQQLDLATFIDAMTRGSAKVLNATSPDLTIGAVADICIFNQCENKLITEDAIFSHGKNTPLLGATLNQSVQTTIVDGRVVYSTQ